MSSCLLQTQFSNVYSSTYGVRLLADNGRMSRKPLALALIVAAAAALSWLALARLRPVPAPSPEPDRPVAVPPAPAVDPAAIDTLLPRDSIRAIDSPRFEPASQAASAMKPGERLIGLVVNGDARAYPIPILSAHEIVNDVVGGEPVAITWCPLCYTALVFSRQVPAQDEPLTFGVSGKLLYNTLVMYDRQTDTLWSQLYGAALDGPLSGQRLSFFPSDFTTWEHWYAQHPQSRVLSKRLTCEQFNCGSYSENPRGSYVVDPYASYYQTEDLGVVDNQIPREAGTSTRKQRLFGVRVGPAARAYPYTVLRQRPLINDMLNGVPLLIWFDPQTESGAAFERRIDGQTLTFRAAVDETGVLVDEQTGSRWQASSGRATSGPLRGRHLPSVVSTSAFAFGWYDYFPESDTYRLPGG